MPRYGLRRRIRVQTPTGVTFTANPLEAEAILRRDGKLHRMINVEAQK